MKKKKKRLKEIAKELRKGKRLDTPAPKVIVPKNVYKRRSKHRKSLIDE